MAKREHIPRKLRHQVFKRDGYRCRECGATNKETTLHIDHIKPVSKGGTNTLDNLQTLCEKCNLAKYTDEWVGGSLSTYPNQLVKWDYSEPKLQKPKIKLTYNVVKLIRLVKLWEDLDYKLIYVKKNLVSAKSFDEEKKYINQIIELEEQINRIINELADIKEINISLQILDMIENKDFRI